MIEFADGEQYFLELTLDYIFQFWINDNECVLIKDYLNDMEVLENISAELYAEDILGGKKCQ